MTRANITKYTYGIWLILISSQIFASFEIQEFELANGMRVLMHNDKQQKQVNIEMLYKAGATKDPKFKSGLASLTQRVLTTTAIADRKSSLNQTIEAYAGSNHHEMFYDNASYNSTINPQHLEKTLELYATLMQPLSFDDQHLNQLINYQLMARSQLIDNDVIGSMLENNQALAYIKSPYRHPLIGWASDLKQINYDDVVQWHKTWYVPNNAILVITGHFEPKQTLKWVEKYFENIPAKTIETSISEEILMPEAQSTITSFWASSPFLLITYHVPSFLAGQNNSDVFSLIIASKLLTRSAQDIIQQPDLFEQDVSDIVTSYTSLVNGSGLFQVMVYLKPNRDPHLTLEKIQNAFETIRQNPIAEKQINISKAFITAQWAYIKETPREISRLIAYSAQSGLEETLIYDYLSHINRTNSQTITQAISQHLNQHNRSTTRLMPSLQGVINHQDVYG